MKLRAHWILVLILLLGAFLRLYHLSSGDMLSDEVAYGLRAIGLVDSFDDPRIQSTPFDWFDPHIPWWAHLSYHDHPPLVFLVEHFSILLLGENMRAVRVPAALFGLGSVLLLYAITRRFFGRTAALLAAAIAALDVNHVFVSRVGLQESELIFLMLLSVWFFFKALEKPRFFLALGFSFGLAMLTKYSAIVMAPAFLVWLLLFRRACFKTWRIWAGIAIALALFSPVIIYNIEMQRAVGHFDLQFSYVFGQRPAIWASSPGKQIGTFADRVERLIPSLVSGNAWPIPLLFAAACLRLLRLLYIRKLTEKEAFLLLWAGSIFGYLLVAGAAPRFVTMLGAPMAVAIGAFFAGVERRAFPAKALLLGGISFFFAFELFYTVNNQILPYPAGPTPWLASDLRYQTYRWGYAEADAYLERELRGRYPAFLFETKYDFIRDIQNADIAAAKKNGLAPYPALILYDGNYELAAEVWLFDRRMLYHGWPIADFNEFAHQSSDGNGAVLIPPDFRVTYLVFQTNRVPAPAAFPLIRRASSHLTLKNKRGDDAFEIYKIVR